MAVSASVKVKHTPIYRQEGYPIGNPAFIGRFLIYAQLAHDGSGGLAVLTINLGEINAIYGVNGLWQLKGFVLESIDLGAGNGGNVTIMPCERCPEDLYSRFEFYFNQYGILSPHPEILRDCYFRFSEFNNYISSIQIAGTNVAGQIFNVSVLGHVFDERLI